MEGHALRPRGRHPCRRLCRPLSLHPAAAHDAHLFQIPSLPRFLHPNEACMFTLGTRDAPSSLDVYAAGVYGHEKGISCRSMVEFGCSNV